KPWRNPKSKGNMGALVRKTDAVDSAESDCNDEINSLEKYYRSFFVGNTEKATFFLDSCSSDHYLPDRDQFENFRRMNDTVSCANMSTSRIAGRGDVTVECKVGEKLSQLELTDAKWIPGFFGNLISVSRLCKEGYKVLFVKGKAYVIKNEKTVMIG